MKYSRFSAAVAFLAMAAAHGLAAPLPAEHDAASKNLKRITKEIRHELVTLPFYDVFDHLAFQLSPDGTKVTLLGSVTRPTLKSSAEKVVKDIEGVESVDNKIDVLPVSPNDDRLRRAVFRAVYGQPGLDRYGFQAIPAIHIIVKNGNVSLEGVVNTEGDKNLAGIQANGVSGVFSVKNNLVLESALPKQ